jgi:hypothetical protein
MSPIYRTFFYTLLLCLNGALPGVGQSAPFPGRLSNPADGQADGHVRIPGTRLSIIPPAQFALTHFFTGFLKTDGSAVIQVYDLTDGDYYTDVKSFSKEQLESKGAKVLVIKPLQVDGFPGKFCYMEGDSSKRIMALIFGDSTFSTTLIGLYPDTALAIGQQIRNAYASISYRKTQVTNPFETAPFWLDTSASPFRFAQYNKPLFIYSLDGKEPAQGSPFLTVTPYPRKEGTSLQDISESLIVKEMQHGLTSPTLKNISFDSLGNYAAYEVEIDCRLGEEEGVIYQLIVASKNNTIVIEGMASSAFDENVKIFRALAHTVKIR